MTNGLDTGSQMGKISFKRWFEFDVSNTFDAKRHADTEPPMQQRTKNDDTKRRLLKAAIKIFARRGFHAATVRDICREARANVAAVNYHYGSKEKLYAATLDHIFKTMKLQDVYERMRAAKGAPEERIRQFIRMQCMAFYGEEPQELCFDMAAIFLMEMANPSPSLAPVVENYVKPQQFLLAESIREYLGPETPDHTVHMCIDSIFGQMLHPAFTWPIDVRLHGENGVPFATDLEAFIHHACEFALAGLRAVRDTRKQ